MTAKLLRPPSARDEAALLKTAWFKGHGEVKVRIPRAEALRRAARGWTASHLDRGQGGGREGKADVVALGFRADEFAIVSDKPGRPILPDAPLSASCTICPEGRMRLGIAWPASRAIFEAGWVRRLDGWPTILAPTRISDVVTTIRARRFVAWAPFVLEADVWRRLHVVRRGDRVTLAVNETESYLIVTCAAPVSVVYREEGKP